MILRFAEDHWIDAHEEELIVGGKAYTLFREGHQEGYESSPFVEVRMEPVDLWFIYDGSDNTWMFDRDADPPVDWEEFSPSDDIRTYLPNEVINRAIELGADQFWRGGDPTMEEQ